MREKKIPKSKIKKAHKNHIKDENHGKIPKLKFSFSFEYFFHSNIETKRDKALYNHSNLNKYFGLGQQKASWYISVIERLKELSNKTIEELLTSHTEQSKYRCHPIDWTGKNVPISLEDLDWIPPYYTENKEEFPLYQITISLALRRIIGFIERTKGVFYIIFFDSLHNLQPSKKFDYKLRDTNHILCEYSDLLDKIQDSINKFQKRNNCDELFNSLKKNLDERLFSNLFLLNIDEKQVNEVEEVLEKHDKTISDLIEYGILFFKQKNDHTT